MAKLILLLVWVGSLRRVMFFMLIFLAFAAHLVASPASA
jgi:hypothetical protein